MSKIESGTSHNINGAGPPCWALSTTVRKDDMQTESITDDNELERKRKHFGQHAFAVCVVRSSEASANLGGRKNVALRPSCGNCRRLLSQTKTHMWLGCGALKCLAKRPVPSAYIHQQVTSQIPRYDFHSRQSMHRFLRTT